LGSAVNIVSVVRVEPQEARIWSTKPSTSSRAKALSSDSIATLWRTLANFSAGGAPTLCEGESGRTSSGKRASMARVALAQRIVVGIGDDRRILLVVAPVVLGDLARQALELGRRPRRSSRLSTGCFRRLLHGSQPACPISRSAWARASSVMLAPDSMRAISSRRLSAMSALTRVTARSAPSSRRPWRSGNARRPWPRPAANG
jgi:hypothetical protein